MAKRRERENISSFLILDLNDGKLYDSGQQEEGKTFHKLHALCSVSKHYDEKKEKSLKKNEVQADLKAICNKKRRGKRISTTTSNCK